MKKLAIFLVIATLCLGFSSCAIGHIEDTNGENTSLCQLNEEDILGINSITEVFSFTTTVNNKTTYKVNKMSGVKTIKKLSRIEGEALVINSNIVLKDGNFRAVVVCNGEIACDIPIGENQTTRIENPNGSYEIRIAGESAGFEITMEFNVE